MGRLRVGWSREWRMVLGKWFRVEVVNIKRVLGWIYFEVMGGYLKDFVLLVGGNGW